MTASRQLLFASACGGIFVFGIVLAILGALFGLPEMRERLDINLAQQGDIFFSLFFGVFVSTILVGPTIDSFGNKLVLAVSAALVTAALVGFSFAQSFAAAMAAAFLLGFGGGGLNTSTNALTSDLYSENRGAMLNLLGTFFGFGALFIPFIAAAITEWLTIPQLFLIAAALAALCFLSYLALRFPPPTEPIGFSLLATVRVAKYPAVLLFAVLLFFQSGNESSIGGWTSTYLGTLGATPRTATWVLAGYWAALMLGRLASAKLLEKTSKETLVFVSGIGAAVGCLILVLSRSVPILALGSIVAGFSFAAIYPTTLAMAADRYQRLAGTIFGLLFACGLLGGMIAPWALGHLSQAIHMRAGMLIPLIGSAMIVVMVTVIRAKK